MIREAFDAIVLDIDGTLVTDEGEIPERTIVALQAAHEAGIRVMLATGRSEGAAGPVLDRLGFDTPALLYNGAALYCPVRRRLLEERLLSNRTVERSLAFARRSELLTVVMRFGEKYARPARNDAERDALGFLEDLHVVSDEELPTENVMRITLFSDRHPDPASLAAELERSVDQPMYLTHFPLSMLAGHRHSRLLVADVQPPCRGKGEALRVLEETYGIPAERVVAVGDAGNDVELLEGAGLGVAVENAVPEARAAADRVIGSNNTEAIAELVEELFAVGRVSG
jgi:Cof subfamily protein (haloacid dehalogenase superfamily)